MSQPVLSVVSIVELEIRTLLIQRRDAKQGAILRARSMCPILVLTGTPYRSHRAGAWNDIGDEERESLSGNGIRRHESLARLSTNQGSPRSELEILKSGNSTRRRVTQTFSLVLLFFPTQEFHAVFLLREGSAHHRQTFVVQKKDCARL